MARSRVSVDGVTAFLAAFFVGFMLAPHENSARNNLQLLCGLTGILMIQRYVSLSNWMLAKRQSRFFRTETTHFLSASSRGRKDDLRACLPMTLSKYLFHSSARSHVRKA